MSHTLFADAALSSPSPVAPLVMVDRAIADLRRGGVVIITAPHHPAMLVQAAEALSEEHLRRLEHLAQAPREAVRLVITGRRAGVLGADEEVASASAVTVEDRHGLFASLVAYCADPLDSDQDHKPVDLIFHATASDGPAAAGVLLAKLARLLPAVVITPVPLHAVSNLKTWAAERSLMWVEGPAIKGYHETAARSLRMVSAARVPVLNSEETRIISFRPADGGIEHLAIVIGEPDPETAILVRLHSECFTGDLLDSLRCDCGDQLRGAIDAIAQAGSGILLYLAQEGRGIGLVNKLRAYQLQDDGFDTLAANGQLGFDDDERLYLPAAEMLRQLGFTRVRLMTNNPAKVHALGRHGVTIEERVPHVFTPNPHNLSYLRTKAVKGGHLF